MSLCINVKAQETKPSNGFQLKEGLAVISEVIPVEGKTKSALYQDALLWINKSFTNPKTVIQTKDSDLGLITLKSKIVIDSNGYQDLYSDEWYTFNFSIQAKDGRYRYEFSDIVYTWDASYMDTPLIQPQKTLEDTKFKNAFLFIINALKKQMARQVEDW